MRRDKLETIQGCRVYTEYLPSKANLPVITASKGNYRVHVFGINMFQMKGKDDLHCSYLYSRYPSSNN